MKKKNLSKLNLKKSIVSELNNSNKIIGGKEKSIHETNCNLCPPTDSDACPSANNDCTPPPQPSEKITCGIFCSLAACYLNI
ncbi:hypothetical protein IMCC3317_15570 [Kordia antarctica]|uniref:Uncharacterized protein n=1 Tax=Kordia antarctica TaxID=1218801 RepID=A0A7L4ZHK1_9FLAO|nr:hypothetical protein [Kordia antarctica]QHI36198.1 hypothetical protein IMCC3317_15570 [Kordia antarctica]